MTKVADEVRSTPQASGGKVISIIFTVVSITFTEIARTVKIASTPFTVVRPTFTAPSISVKVIGPPFTEVATIVKIVESIVKEIATPEKDLEPTVKQVAISVKEIERIVKQVETTFTEQRTTFTEVEARGRGIAISLKEIEIIFTRGVARGGPGVGAESLVVVAVDAVPLRLRARADVPGITRFLQATVRREPRSRHDGARPALIVLTGTTWFRGPSYTDVEDWTDRDRVSVTLIEPMR